MRLSETYTCKRSIGIVLMFLFVFAARAAGTLTLSQLKTSWLDCPAGIDDERPTFSWVLDAPDAHDVMQHAYRLVVATDEKGRKVVWDSGKTPSGQSVAVAYGGPRLQPSTRYYWRVTVWAGGTRAAASAHFETGLMDAGWDGACWISADTTSHSRSCPLFRKQFRLRKGIAAARLYTSSLGIHDLHVNGVRVEGTELKPGCTLYDKTVFYVTHDVTALLREGSNAIGAQLAAGWWSGPISTGMYGDSPPLAFLAKLLVTYRDGTQETVVTDTSWRALRNSALTLGDIYDGEDYDARCYLPFSSPSFDDSGWRPAAVCTAFHGKVKAWAGPPVRVRSGLSSSLKATFTLYDGIRQNGTDYGMLAEAADTPAQLPVTVKKGQRLVFDFGQDMTGWVRFSVRGKSGVQLALRFGEMLNDSGSVSRGNDGPGHSVYRANLREARATLQYTLSGADGGESYQPWATWFGFRYCEVTATDDVTLLSLVPQVVGSDLAEYGMVTTSDPDVNRLFLNQLWGQRSNFLSIPMDCPQRNERSGWTADAHIFSATAMYNADCQAFYRKWLADLRDSQRDSGAYPDVAPLAANRGHQQANGAWGDAGIILPWNLYVMYGDRATLQEHYPSMKRYMDYLATLAADGFRYNGAGTAYGDWCAYVHTDARYVSVCYYACDALLMGRMARALSTSADDRYTQDAAAYEQLYRDIKAEFADRYLTDGVPRQQTQTALLLALRFGLLPDEASRQKTATALRRAITDNGMMLNTGFIGTSLLCPTLSDTGADDLAYALLMQHGNPSWLYSVDENATTIWEHWDSYTIESGFGNAGMNSFNHYAYGAVGEWMYRYMAGIEPDPGQPGFRHFFLHPRIDGTTHDDGRQPVTSASATTHTPYGTVSSAWQRLPDGNCRYECTVPANTTATLVLPGSRQTVGSGRHVFTFNHAE